MSRIATDSKRMRPAKSIEAEEQQCIALAVDLVKKRLLEGTASAQETTHFLKLGTVKAQMDKEEQRARIDLMKAKKKAIESGELQDMLYNEAVKAIRSYQGVPSNDQGINPNIQ